MSENARSVETGSITFEVLQGSVATECEVQNNYNSKLQNFMTEPTLRLRHRVNEECIKYKKSVQGTYIQLTTGVTVQTHSLFGDCFARNEKNINR